MKTTILVALALAAPAVAAAEPSSVHVTIDATRLTPTIFSIDHLSAHATSAPVDLELAVGHHTFCAPIGSCFGLDVAADGTLAVDSVFAHASGTTLVVEGAELGLDASALASAAFSLNHGVVQAGNQTATPGTLRLLPGPYTFCAPASASCVDFAVEADGRVAYAGEADGFLAGRGTRALRVTGAPVRIDASGLAAAFFTLDHGQIGGAVPTATPVTMNLLGGLYVFCAPYSSNCTIFRVLADGTVDYDAADEGALSGRGTSQLVVKGRSLRIDATALSAPGFYLQYGTVGHGLYSTAQPVDAALVPGTYQLCAPNPSDCVAFSLDAAGHVDYADELDGILLGRGSAKLVVRGRAISLDARALAAPTLYLQHGTMGPQVSTRDVLSLTVLPGDYVVCAPGASNCLTFSVGVAGRIDYAAALDGQLSGRGSTELVLHGAGVTIDARGLSANRFILQYGQLGPAGGFPTATPAALALLPGTYVLCAPATADCVSFDVQLDGTLAYAAELDGLLAGRGTRVLAVSGRSIVVDARGLGVERFGLAYGEIGGSLPTAEPITVKVLPGPYPVCAPPALPCVWFEVRSDGTVDYAADLDDRLAGRGSAWLRLGVPGADPSTPVVDTPIAMTQTPEQALADYERLRGQPLPHLPEHDSLGRPTFFYGRVFVRQRRELGMLELLHFEHSHRPFFDEYDGTKIGRLSGEGFERGFWEYAIATGAQWNLLTEITGAVSAAELNPRLDPAAPHPVLDSFLAEAGGLDPVKLANTGFTLTPMRFRDTCAIGDGMAFGFFDFVDDIGDFIVDTVDTIVSEAANFALGVLKRIGKDLATVLREAAQGIDNAIDALRELMNAGACVLLGEHSVSGHIYVSDEKSLDPKDPRVRLQYGPDRGQPEPIRSATVRARDHLTGILHTEAPIGPDGRYQLDHLCGELDYTLAVELDTPYAWVTYNGLFADTIDLGVIQKAYPEHDFTTNAPSARWLIGAQMAANLAPELLGFYPKQAKIILGTPAKLAGKFNGGAAFCACGQMSALSTLGYFFPPALLVSVLLDGDIYGPPLPDWKIATGVAVHEYGHYLLCESVRQRGGDANAVQNAFLIKAIGLNEEEQLRQPLRSTHEAFADYVAFQTWGYTDYFSPDADADHRCSSPPGSSSGCLEDDWLFSRTPFSNAHQLVASRASIFYDFFDAARRDLGFGHGRPMPFFLNEDDHITIPGSFLAWAAAHVGTQVSLENIANVLATNDQLGRPGEAICEIFQNHGWSCGQLATSGAHLPGPSYFDGVAVSTNQIRWRWVPRSILASEHVVVDPTRGEVARVAADQIATTVTYAGVGPNQRVVAWVEARRNDAQSGVSARQARCTLAAAVAAPTLSQVDGAIRVEWLPDNGGIL